MLDFGVGVAGQRSGPGDVAMAVRAESVAAFAEDPAVTFEAFAEREKIGGDDLLRTRETLWGKGTGEAPRYAEYA